MSAEDIVTTTTIVYDVRGIDRTIRQNQRLLFTVNAIRLSIEDFKRLAEDPSLGNLLWTGIQLTRVWTNLLRMVKATNQAQRFGLAQGAFRAGGVARGAGALRGVALGQTQLAFGAGGDLGINTVSRTGLWATVMGFAVANPVTAGVIGGAVLTAGIVGYDMRQKRIRNDWILRQREIAKSQGLEV